LDAGGLACARERYRTVERVGVCECEVAESIGYRTGCQVRNGRRPSQKRIL